MKITVNAPDISCSHCAMTIKRELGGVKGISNIEVDVPAKSVTFDYTDAETLARAQKALEEAGYPVAE